MKIGVRGDLAGISERCAGLGTFLPRSALFFNLSPETKTMSEHSLKKSRVGRGNSRRVCG